MTILLPMAGPQDDFREKGYSYIKPLIEVEGKPLIQHVWEHLNPLKAGRHIFVIRKEDVARYRLGSVLKLVDPNAIIVQAESPTAGAACTALLAIKHIDPEGELIITNGDQIIESDLSAALESFRSQNADGGTLVFDSVHPRWSFVRVNSDGLIVEAAEKRPISRWATAGFYYFKRGKDFIDSAMNMIRKDASVNGNFFICPAFNEMVLNHKRLCVHEISRTQYRSLATPQDVEQFEASLIERRA